ncbi:hypothetical protein RchiOBHm_Chr5g0004391 [Rosa chinensis]|uniref:Uncharacterized protein n=1 Tax=Rosa chinensis TaxID=74649 RepID=A0A2P6Q303_ROSCH|nr:hypothetical protein RchiOBHm_Chr5g0004391 [Rosa chinensis]
MNQKEALQLAKKAELNILRLRIQPSNLPLFLRRIKFNPHYPVINLNVLLIN